MIVGVTGWAYRTKGVSSDGLFETPMNAGLSPSSQPADPRRLCGDIVCDDRYDIDPNTSFGDRHSNEQQDTMVAVKHEIMRQGVDALMPKQHLTDERRSAFRCTAVGFRVRILLRRPSPVTLMNEEPGPSYVAMQPHTVAG